MSAISLSICATYGGLANMKENSAQDDSKNPNDGIYFAEVLYGR